MSTAGSLVKGSALRTLDLFVMLLSTFFVTPYLVHALGNDLYGFWMVVNAVVGYYGFLDLGLSAAAARFMSQALGKDDADEVERVANTAYWLFGCAAVVVVAATLLTALACPLFARDPSSVPLLRKLIVIMGVSAAAGFPFKVYSGLLTAGIRYDHIASISIARHLLLAGAILLCLRAGLGVVAVALATLAVSLLQYAALAAAAKSLFPQVELSFFRGDRARARAMFGYGSRILVCQLGDLLRFRAAPAMIAAFLGASLVTPYSIGVRLAEGFGQLVASSVGMMLPVFSRYEGRGDYDAIRRALLRVTKVSTIMATFIGLSAIFYGRAFIHRWMGPGFESSYAVAVLLCSASIIALPQSPGIQMLYGLSKHRTYAKLSVCEGLVNIALSAVLLRYFGIYGVALGALAEVALFKLLIQPVYICRAAGLTVRSYLVDTILVTMLKTAAPLAGYFWLIGRFVAADYAVLAAAAAVQTLLFLPLAYLAILDDDERRFLAGAALARGAGRVPGQAR